MPQLPHDLEVVLPPLKQVDDLVLRPVIRQDQLEASGPYTSETNWRSWQNSGIVFAAGVSKVRQVTRLQMVEQRPVDHGTEHAAAHPADYLVEADWRNYFNTQAAAGSSGSV